MSSQPFRDRVEAGEVLGQVLARYRGRDDVVVLALPRGGVPVAREVARALGVPFDVFVVRKLGVPGHEELAMGAIAAGGVRLLNDEVINALGIPPDVIDSVAEDLSSSSSFAVSGCIAAIERPSDSPTRPSSSWTTAWPPDRRCAPP